MTYNSPIKLHQGDVQAQLDGAVMTAVYNVGITVDKEELIKALEYDRDQYDAGYRAGKEAATIHSSWKFHKNGDGTCKHCHTTQLAVWDMDRWQNYCGHCGARMDGDHCTQRSGKRRR